MSLPDVVAADPVASLVRPPASLRALSLALAILFPLGVVVSLLVPWQQSALAPGRVIAFAPEDREQVVEAPVGGVIVAWLVEEGEAVAEGTPVAEVRDNDPGLLGRLDDQRSSADDEQTALEEQLRSYEAKREATQLARDLQMAETRSKLAALERKRVGEATELEVEQLQLDRLTTLGGEGLVSDRNLELARLKRDKASAGLQALDREIDAVVQMFGKAQAEGDAKVASVTGELEAARAKLEDLRRKQLELDTRVARQEAQIVRAPRAGRIHRLHGGPGAGQVKQGDPIATLVPDTDRRAAEIWVDGNDMPLVRAGAAVRLVFEGWPALQFVGLQGTSRGTFGARVAFVDPTDDGKGRFRVVVVPDDTEETWPSAELLRQGVRVKGWVLLGRVPLGYELWRRVNGFPPLPTIDKGDAPVLPGNKKPRTPVELK